MAMPTDDLTLTTCPRCGETLSDASAVGDEAPVCRRCQTQPNCCPSPQPAGSLLHQVWDELLAPRTWGQVFGWSLLLATTYIPVMVLWGAHRLKPQEPLLPIFVAVSVLGGAIGMPWCYPKKGYRLPGLIAGPLFGPGVFLTFGLLAGQVMNRYIFAGLVMLGGAPSFALYVWLLCRTIRSGSRQEMASGTR
jgi:hypothetical protein